MALRILGAYGGLNKKEPLDCVFVGELSLDGGIRGVRGTLPIAIEARSRKIQKLIVPEVNLREAAMVRGIEVFLVKSLLDVIHFVNAGNGIAPVKVDRDTRCWARPNITRLTSKTFAASRRPSARWRSAVPGDTTS